MMSRDLVNAAGRCRYVRMAAGLVALAGFFLPAHDPAQASITTDLQLYSSMSGTTPYLPAAYWEDVSGNRYDGRANPVAYDGGGNRATAVDFSNTTLRMRVLDGYDTLLDPGIGDYSVSLWYHEVTATGFRYLLTNGNNSGSAEAGFCLATNNGQPLIRMNDVDEAAQTRAAVAPTTGNLSGAWRHLVAVFDRTGAHGDADTVYLYIDNEVKSSVVLTPPFEPYNVTNVAKDLWLGGRDHASTYAFDGYMDDVAIYRGALSPADIGTLYTATSLNAATITTPGITPVMIHNFETNRNGVEKLGVVPDDYNGHPGALHGSGAATVSDPIRGEVLEFHGVSTLNTAELTPVAEHALYGDVLDPMSGSYTVSLWFKAEVTGMGQMLASKGLNTSTEDEGWSMFLSATEDPSGHVLHVRGNHDGTLDNRLGVKQVVSPDQWHHVALVIDQENGLFKAYLDGLGSGATGIENGWELLYGNAFLPGVEFDSTEPLALGYSNSGHHPLTGRLDDFAIWNRALSDADILSLYNGATFPPPPQNDIPGDADGNGRVDEEDAKLLAAHWGADGATWAMGDFDRDGLVGPKDAAILAANWGFGVSEATAATVPEPGAAALLLTLLGGVATALGRRR